MSYLKSFFVVLICVCLPAVMLAQNDIQDKEKESVKLLIHKLFDGMREGDSAKVASVFHLKVNMYTTYTDKEGEKIVREGALGSFLKAIGTPHDQVWDEKIWNTKIHIDGGIAQVWTDYSFHVGTEFSHCGVDAFNLIRDNEKGWLIVSLMDTRRKDECETLIK